MAIICDYNIKETFLCLNPVSTLKLASNLSFTDHVYPAEYSHPLNLAQQFDAVLSDFSSATLTF